MTDIPEDAMKAARGLLDAEFLENGDRPIWGPPDQFIGLIACAILAERERCAKVADFIGEQYGADETGWYDCSDAIAEAIRRGDGP